MNKSDLYTLVCYSSLFVGSIILLTKSSRFHSSSIVSESINLKLKRRFSNEIRWPLDEENKCENLLYEGHWGEDFEMVGFERKVRIPCVCSKLKYTAEIRVGEIASGTGTGA